MGGPSPRRSPPRTPPGVLIVAQSRCTRRASRASPVSTAMRAMRCFAPRSSFVGRRRRSQAGAASCPSAARRRPITCSTRRPGGHAVRALRRQGHALSLQLHVPARGRRPARPSVPLVHLDHRRSRRRGAAPRVDHRDRCLCQGPAPRFTEHAARRGWSHLRLLSSAGSTYNTDYHAEAPDGSQWPLATVFVRRDGRIHHSWSSELFFAPSDPEQHPRHVDLMWPVWKILDLTPGGRGDFDPQLAYGK